MMYELPSLTFAKSPRTANITRSLDVKDSIFVESNLKFLFRTVLIKDFASVYELVISNALLKIRLMSLFENTFVPVRYT